jgi:general secretion pathway protein D
MSSPTAVTDRFARALSACLALALLAGGCVSTGMRAGQLAEQAQDHDRAVVEYTKVLKEHPDNKDARLALERAKLRAALDHYNRGLRLRNGGRLDEALVELQIAVELNPASGDIDSALGDVRSQLRNKVAVTREGKTQLETLIERSRDLPALGVDLPTDAKVPAATFRDASARDIFTALGRFAGVNVVFDPTYRDQPVTIDIRSGTLEAALQALAASTRNFYRVTAQRTITVVPDTPAKRREYEEEVVRTFFLSNADLKETMDTLRVVVDIRRVATSAATNAITIKDTPERIAAASRIITAIDKARPEVVIDVELLEVDRTRLRDYGLQLASPGDPEAIGIDGQASINRSTPPMTVRSLRNLTSSDIFLTNLPGLYYRLLKADHNTRTLANPQLRASEGIAAQARFGERVPVPVTTFSPIATGGVAQQPITSFNYENIGVNIDITPRTHHDDQVTLSLKIAVSSISGTGYQGLPTFGNREINTMIRLKDGETNLLAGLIRDDERRTLEGVPGLVDIPVVGRLFARSKKETQETDIVLTLTPRIVRVLDLNESDVRAFKVGRDGDGGGPIELPIPAALPPPAQAPAAAPPPAQPAPPPAGAAPILPPVPK